MDWNAASNLITALIGAAGFGFTVWTRYTAKHAAISAKDAANSAKDAAANTAKSGESSVQVSHDSEYTKAAVEKLERRLGYMADRLDESLAAQDRMARRNDDTLGALLQAMTLLDGEHVPRRLQRIEQFMADIETDLHRIAG